MKIRHITSARQFDTSSLKSLFTIADKVKKGQYNNQALSQKVMAAIFYEPSTRTRFSFESAMLRLGGGVISTENAAQFSSAAKGETLEDTIRVVNSYSDVIVLRHFEPGSSDIAAKFSQVPVINAGDGNGEHPTQALLDLYTIFSQFSSPEFTIAMMGDLTNGRTIHSLSYMLSLYPKVKITFISPKDLSIPPSLSKHLKNQKIKFFETEDIKEITNADIVYQTRIQKERFKNKEDYKKYFGKHVIDPQTIRFLKKKAIIMHPLPRVNEITNEIDTDPRAKYFQQAQNGVYIRMALLLSVFDKV